MEGPAARPSPAPETIRIVEGIKVPPRPEEPDNCCMSYVPFTIELMLRGCLHCVWDLYREDIEDWQNSRRRAREALKARGKSVPIWLGGMAGETEVDPLVDVDPGLRAFMELEKMLKERREARLLKA
jgi:predicted  nucleic acid-binding Zn-ribbon protein